MPGFTVVMNKFYCAPPVKNTERIHEAFTKRFAAIDRSKIPPLPPLSECFK